MLAFAEQRESCSVQDDECERWAAATRTYLDELSEAYEQLGRAHGVTTVKIRTWPQRPELGAARYVIEF
jgi:hypothetical protein